MKVIKFKHTIAVAVIILIILLPGYSTIAQENHNAPNTKIAVGASVSTAGPGLSLAYGISNPLIVRLGVEQMSFNVPFSFEENDIDYDANLNYRAGSFSLIADFNFTRFLFVSAGAGFNLFKPVVDGYASDKWKYGDIYIPSSDIGEFTFTVQPSNRLSPYIGGGVGRKIARTGRVAFSLEAGVFHQGPPKITIEATGLLAPTASEAHKHKEYLENQFSGWQVYPVLKAGLSVLLSK